MSSGNLILPEEMPHNAVPSLSRQLELFSEEMLRGAGRPLRVTVHDPNRSDLSRSLVAASSAMRDLLSHIDEVAATNAIVLLLGESGTGKNLLAWLIHQLSSRRGGPFIHFSAGQRAEQLMESELFGHEKGAFTGAHETRKGKVELAHGGSLFIDEIAELGPLGQLKFHRLLDDRRYERVGGTQERIANVRVIAATHQDLRALSREGRFREDLYHRVNVVCLRVPSLRERAADIAPIAQEVLVEFSGLHNKPGLRWTREALDVMVRLPWYGNIRELRNLVERTVVFARDREIQPHDLPVEMFLNTSREGKGTPSSRPPEKSEDHGGMHRFHGAYKATGGNKSAMARLLCTSRSQVARLEERFGRPE